MNSELFPVEAVASLSPKLLWMQKHDLETAFHPNGGSECPETGDIIPNWVCRAKHPRFRNVYCSNEIGGGGTEDEACAALARARGIKLWFEEGA